MIINYIILFLIVLNSKITFGQVNNDSTHKSLHLVPRFGMSVQKAIGIEGGLFLNNFFARMPKVNTFNLIPYSSTGFFISSEINLTNSYKIIIGPKLGWELGVVGETHGSFFGVEFINYTDFNKYSPALMFKIGAPLLWLNIGYGYSAFIKNTLKDETGSHRLIASYTINRKAKREYKRIKMNLKNIQKDQ